MPYQVNEIFYSLQGEGMRAGTANVFVRFSGCNLACDVEPGERSPGGFACDTEFASGRTMEADEIVATATGLWPRDQRGHFLGDGWVIFTGGEPGLQLDYALVGAMHDAGFSCAVETNGTVDLLKDAPGSHYQFDWVTLSPKVAEHALKLLVASELKYVRGHGQGIPRPLAKAEHYLISPAFDGGVLRRETLDWCIKLCLDNPGWRLSVQQHKLWNVR